MLYTITNPSDIFTLIMNVYGTLEESIAFVSDNVLQIPSLSANISMLAGQEVDYNPASVATFLSPLPVLPPSPAPITQYTWMGHEGQNMFDVCIQTYGILDAQIKLLNDNNLDFGSTVFEQEFSYNSTQIANSNIWNRSTGMGIIFSTGDAPEGGSFDGSFEFDSFEKTTVY